MGKARVRRLLRRFEQSHRVDAPLLQADLFSLKHYVRFSDLCAVPTIKVDPKEHGGPLYDWSVLPRFLMSQFASQNLIGSSLFPGWLIVAIYDLVHRAGTKTHRFPTLFRWYLPTHSTRTYYLFTYLTIDMGRREYTVAELMAVRDLAVVPAGLPKWISNPELGKEAYCCSLSHI